MKEIISRKVLVPNACNSIYSDYGFSVGLDDEGAGCFVVVSQPEQNKAGLIAIDAEEWEQLKKMIDEMIESAKQLNGGGNEQ